MDIKYKLEFFTYWHCGSGLGAGADLDATVIKDNKKLPFVPGKTIKGLLREAAEILFNGNSDQIEKAFGFNSESKNDTESEKKSEQIKGEMFFTNASLPEEERSQITDELSGYLYDAITSTAIDDKGIANDHSLRKIEVVVPCTLEGEILDVPESFQNEMKDTLKFVKRLGVNRNRGLGRCKFTILEEGGEK